MNPGISDRLAQVRSRMADAARRAGRKPEDTQLVAVSKAHPPEALHEALDAGQTLFGENRVQEARAKMPLVSSRARWHFIGHLQKNKIRQALPVFEILHSVDSLELARDIQRIADEDAQRPRVLLEVNVAGEGTKFGFKPAALETELETLITETPRLEILGLMAIPPISPKPEDSRRYFVALRTLRDRLQDKLRVGLPELSMGMSGDYEVAIEEGATLVRVGTAIFGERKSTTWKPASTEPD
ncbi:MAG: YggS family pyridoxal phosphate-dependent enzyme [Chthoniobacteraceae bacterium]|jgi:pyridoxal phosphate enzyme (YggS family)